VTVLAIATFLAGRAYSPRLIAGTIILCVTALAFYKYTSFLTTDIIGVALPELGAALGRYTQALLPAMIPLGISFFTFEFVHYLTDLRHGSQPIRRVGDFLAFALFWPTMVSGPIKRHQQFVPALHGGLASPSATDAMIGLIRVAIGFAKQWGADNLTGWIEYMDPQYAAQSLGWRWIFLLALAFRILLDFGGYSDMAIGFTRMMGIVVPENFNWPYIARTPIEFWQRWHISLSLWIRDYIYIPLGGNRFGVPRRIINALTAMALCGLWHGPSWNFVVWGLYHGLGLTAATFLQRLASQLRPAERIVASSIGAAALKRTGQPVHVQLTLWAVDLVSWAATMIFVGVGWLLFFYPIEKAVTMAIQLFTW
jgi:alginate O-acetyltransferase complex protein AlgI